MAAAPRAAPHVGFGLYKVAPPDCYAITQAALRAGYAITQAALRAGYRHVDIRAAALKSRSSPAAQQQAGSSVDPHLQL